MLSVSIFLASSLFVSFFAQPAKENAVAANVDSAMYFVILFNFVSSTFCRSLCSFGKIIYSV